MSFINEDLLEQYGIPLDGEQKERLECFHGLLCEWNRVMDLTNVPEEEMTLRHYADSLMPAFQYPRLFHEAKSLIDVGTGAGFPGILLAIRYPGMRVTLLEAQQKRCDFLEKVKEKADLRGVQIVHMRAEDGGKSPAFREKFDVSVARAVASLPVLMEYLLPFVRVGGNMLAWKGPGVREEMQAGTAAAGMLGGGEILLHPVSLPGMEHLLVQIPKVRATPALYPRKAGLPAKKPLGKH